jgi:TonB family protein
LFVTTIYSLGEKFTRALLVPVLPTTLSARLLRALARTDACRQHQHSNQHAASWLTACSTEIGSRHRLRFSDSSALVRRQQQILIGSGGQMTDTWKRLEGLLVDGTFSLHKYLWGSRGSAVFLTKWCAGNMPKAAIKLVLESSTNVEEILGSWRLAMKLSHPHLLRLFQAGRCELEGLKLLYLVMEYAEESLSEILPERPLTEAEAYAMSSTVLQALSYLHGQGLVHGRLKPANIVAVGNRLKISADGICTMAQANPYEKASPYDPPEALSAPRSTTADVWSFGLTLIEALTQQLPSGERTEDGQLVLRYRLAAPFLSVAKGCLCLDPLRRLTVAEIQNHLGLPITVAPAADSEEQSNQVIAQRHSVVLGSRKFSQAHLVVALAFVIVLAALVIGVTLSKQHSRPEPTRNRSSQQITEKHSSPPSVISEDQVLATSKAVPDVPTRPESVGLSGGGFVRGTVVKQVLPRVPSAAKRTIQGKVKVRVRVAVDSSGRVTQAALDSSGPSPYFARIAIEAARGWRFTPVRLDGQDVASEWILAFEFRRAGIKVFPALSAAAGRRFEDPQFASASAS